MQFLNEGVFFMKGKQNPNLHGPVWKSACPLNLITGWATLSSNKLPSSVCDNLQWVRYSAVEEFWPTHLGRIVVIQPHWRVFEHEPPFKVMPQHLNRIQVRTWLGHSKVFILFFFSHSEVGFAGVLDHCPAAEPKFASAWGHEQMAGHCPSGFFGRQQNSWFHLSQQVFQVLKQQNSPRPSHYHHHILLLVWCLFLNAVLLLRQM